nr:MAG TPA: hypothetical protein [Caudoviricetes sp.]
MIQNINNNLMFRLFRVINVCTKRKLIRGKL